jgi:aspartate/methionine/tyrosine aminotransferase
MPAPKIMSTSISKSATISESALAVPGSRIRELAEIAMGMEGVLKLYFGESDVPTPEFIQEAARKAMADGHTYYTENGGIPSLREELARYYQRIHGVSLDPIGEIAVMTSGVQALSLTLRCLVDPGDEALVLTPAWPNGASILRLAHAVVHEIPQVLAGSRYAVDYEALERAVTPRTRVLVYTSPSNPLGWVAREADQDKLLEFARRHKLWLVADEVYERLYYLGDVVPSILKKATREDRVIVVQSFSKAWCMTGWRLGWFIAPKDFLSRVVPLNEFMMSCPVSFIQKAAETALRDGEPWIRSLVERLRGNRDYALAALRRMPGVIVPEPDGAFYLFPKIQGAEDSYAFAERLLRETKVGLAPGVAFGAGGEGSVRICYASQRAVIEEAMDRMSRALKGC